MRQRIPSESTRSPNVGVPVRSMHPRDFVVDQTWLAFRMNRLAIIVQRAEFDSCVLQDAASLISLRSVAETDKAHLGYEPD